MWCAIQIDQLAIISLVDFIKIVKSNGGGLQVLKKATLFVIVQMFLLHGFRSVFENGRRSTKSLTSENVASEIIRKLRLLFIEPH